MSSDHTPLTLETAFAWARSGHASDKVYRFLFLHPEDFFTIPEGRSWSIAHQVVYHGDVELLKRILALFSDDQINIRTVSNDKKTLLDVAQERRKNFGTMYNFVEHLFLQDDLIQAARDSNWRSVRVIIEKNPQLINEKPPYSTYFLLHYVVQNGDKYILKDFLENFQFETNILSSENETPIDMANRLKQYDMVLLLEPTRARSNSDLIKYKSSSSPLCDNNRSDEKSLPSTPVEQTSPSSTLLNSTACSIDSQTDSFPIGFESLLLNLSENGKFTVKTSSHSNSIQIEPSITKQQQTHTQTQHVNTKESLVKQNSKLNIESSFSTPVTQTSKDQLMKNLTCSLTQKIFVDPVIASDGQTYERKAIIDWINQYHFSPTTGAPMDMTFKDNTEIKQIILSMKIKH